MQWRDILAAQAEAGAARLTEEEATILYEKADLAELQQAALERRRTQVPGGVVSYMVDRNVNYTNVCTINCQFCSFYRPPGHAETYTQTYEQISERVRELEDIEGVRILMQGGVHPDLPIEWYEDLLRHLRTNHPTIALDCFSPIEIEGIADVTERAIEGIDPGHAAGIDHARNRIVPGVLLRAFTL